MTAPIRFEEGEMHTVNLNFTNFNPAAYAHAKIEVRQQEDTPVVMSFSTDNSSLTVTTTSATFIISAALSIGKVGRYKWQIMFWNSPTDVAKLKRGDLEIQKTLVQI